MNDFSRLIIGGVASFPEIKQTPMNTPLTKASVEFTTDEASALLKLIDIAIQAKGINVSEAGTVLFKKINSAFEPPKELNVLQQLPQNGN